MPTTVLGLIGPAQSGKDTFAERLVEAHGYTRVAFADPLKAVAYAIDLDLRHTTLRHLVDEFGWDEAKRDPRVRAFLQNVGSAVRDHADRDIWLNGAKEEVAAAHGPVVITDVRYFNEADWIADRLPGGALVRVVRSVSQERNALQGELAQHASETELATYPAEFTAYNDSTIARLHRQADTIARLVA